MRLAGLFLPLLVACSFTAEPSSGPTGDAPEGIDAAPGDGPGSGCPDVDQDGVCDAMDDWLCGTKPAAPGDGGTFGHPVWLMPQPSNVAGINLDGNGAVITATSGATIDLRYAYGVVATCPTSATCRAQIEYGIAGGARLGCLFDGDIANGILTGSLFGHVTFALPSWAGRYDLRAKLAFGTSCGTQTTWSGGTDPDPAQTFGYICVP